MIQRVSHFLCLAYCLFTKHFICFHIVFFFYPLQSLSFISVRQGSCRSLMLDVCCVLVLKRHSEGINRAGPQIAVPDRMQHLLCWECKVFESF